MSVSPSTSPQSPSTPLSNHNHTPDGLKHIFSKYRTRGVASEPLNPSSRFPPPRPSPPPISKLTKAFVDSLNTQKLSDFLLWMLYYELVELPEDPEAWYKPMDHIEMRDWVALGGFISKCPATMDTGSGFDLVVLHSICDRLQLRRNTVYDLLVRFANQDAMVYSQIATIKHAGGEAQQTELETLKAIQFKLKEYSRLATRLMPTEGSTFENWHAIILKRVRGFLDMVICPRITASHSGVPLVTIEASVRVPEETRDAINLKSLYEVMQQKRQVPLSRYGMFSDASAISLVRTHSISPDAIGVSGSDMNQARSPQNHLLHLTAENRALRAQVASLLQEIDDIKNSYHTLGRRFINLDRDQQLTHTQQSKRRSYSSIESSCSSSKTNGKHILLPSGNTLPRSWSLDTGRQLTADVDEKLHSPKHKRQHSDILSWKYEDVFVALDSPPSPHIRLLDPATGELLEPTSSQLPLP
jgi:hypothetical protein